MVALARNQVNTTDKLNWYITVNGVLTDAFEVGFHVCDVTGGYPGTQIFPAVPGTYEDVTAAPGRFSVGSYYAFDSGTVLGWKVPLGEPLGTHVINWRWKINAAAPYQQSSEEFEVLPESVGATGDTYCSLADIRALGITVPQASDATILATIALVQELLDRATRQWFVPRTLQFKFDGTDSDALHFGVPIIAIDWIKINDSIEALDPTLYRAYKGRSYPDDRRNPRIKLIGPYDGQDIFTAPIVAGTGVLRFRKGRQNQEIRGTFGFVEDSGNTPAPIKEAACRMVIERLASPAYIAPGAPIISPPSSSGGGPLVEEETDGHRLKWASASLVAQRPGLTGISRDPFVLDVIKLFRAPLGLVTPAHWTYG